MLTSEICYGEGNCKNAYYAFFGGTEFDPPQNVSIDTDNYKVGQSFVGGKNNDTYARNIYDAVQWKKLFLKVISFKSDIYGLWSLGITKYTKSDRGGCETY